MGKGEIKMNEMIFVDIQTVDGSRKVLAEIIDENLLITKNASLFVITHRHTGYLIAAFDSIESARTVAICIKRLDWRWNSAAELPTNTKEAVHEIFMALKFFIKFCPQK